MTPLRRLAQTIARVNPNGGGTFEDNEHELQLYRARRDGLEPHITPGGNDLVKIGRMAISSALRRRK